MAHRQRLELLFYGIILSAAIGLGQTAARPGYDIDFIGPPLADPVLQHSKETYVLYGCAYCHGLDLVSRGEATDLMHSRLVGQDVNGSLIIPLLKAGIPQTAKLSPMPQFSDLSDQQLGDLARWIHYARQQGRYKELTQSKDPAPGNAATGQAYFEQTCSACHANATGLVKTQKSDPSSLRSRILRPAFVDAPQSWKLERLHDAKTSAARQRHLSLLENYSAEDVANLMAYLQSVTRN